MCTVCKFIVLNYLLFGSRLGRINSSSSTPQRTRRHTHGIALLCVSFRSHARATITTDASTVSKRTYAHSTVSKKRIKTLAACTSRALSLQLSPRRAARTPQAQRSLADHLVDQHARVVLRFEGMLIAEKCCSDWRAVAAGISMAHARSSTEAPSGISVATGSFWTSMRLGTRGAASEVSGVALYFRLAARASMKHTV